jgi:hypothetical protein
MEWLRWPGASFGLLAVGFLSAGLWVAAPQEPDSRFSAAQQVAMQQWNLSVAWPEFLTAIIAAAASVGCFAAAGWTART